MTENSVVENGTKGWKTAQQEETESHANNAKELDTSRELVLIQEQTSQQGAKLL